jgi:flagellar biosynthesis regulator FlbT
MTEKIKLVFAPGCFDSFEGSQEELDSLISEITAKFESGEIMEEAEEIDPLTLDPEDREALESILAEIEADEENTRRLH